MLLHRGLLKEKYEKHLKQFVSLGDGWGPVSLECCLKLPHIQNNHSPVKILRGLDKDRVEFSDLPSSRCVLLLI